MIKKLIKNETVLCISFVLALISSFIVIPDKEYLGYTDYRTIALLFCLMIIVAGLENYGIFRKTAEFLTGKTKSVRMLSLILTLICFFGSMIITNDVALITFVPFTLYLFDRTEGGNAIQPGNEDDRFKSVMKLVILETIAANLGSMATPIGNPQNLYLYSVGNLSNRGFIMAVLPYAGLSLVLLTVFILTDKRDDSDISVNKSEINNEKQVGESNRLTRLKTVMLGMLLILCILVVFKVISYIPVLIIVMAGILIINARLYRSVDYSLLLTFICFFIFIGNMKRIPEVTELLTSLVSGNELVSGIFASQVISNVPAAILLSGFCSDFGALITGVNIGGLGTLIASMASLISFKFFASRYRDKKGEYLKYFTVWNIVFLIPLILEAFILRVL